jgi:hypothetical protein
VSHKTDVVKRQIQKAARELTDNDSLAAQDSTGQTKQKTAKKLTWPAQAAPTKINTGPDHYGQQGTTAAANRARIKVSGQDSRTRGYVSARCKRSQASRDAKS